MRSWIMPLLVLAALVMGSNSSQAEFAYADSDSIAIDTVTPVDDPAATVPRATRLAGIYPNPFNPATTIAFDLATDSQVELAIFDVRGGLVQIVESRPYAAGRHQAIWNGTDRDGRGLPSGTYFCRFVAGKHTQTMKLLLTK